MKGIDDNKFKAESSKATALASLEFILKIDVTAKDAQTGFLTLQNIFTSLQNLIHNNGIPNALIKVSDPGETSQRVKTFKIGTHYGLKKKMSVSLDIQLLASFSENANFWSKGLAIAAIIDLLETFSDTQGKEKDRFVFLEKSKIPEETETVEKP